MRTGFLTPRTRLQLLYPTDNSKLSYRMPRRDISSSQSWKTRLKIGRQVSPSIDEGWTRKTAQAENLGWGMKLGNTGVGVGYVAWKIAGSECFAGGVAPGAGEGILPASELEVETGGESGEGVAAREHAAHVCHAVGIKR